MLFAVILSAVTVLYWRRGTEMDWRRRLHLARRRLGPVLGGALALSIAGLVATGCYIYYNTNVLNEYVPGDVARQRRAELTRVPSRPAWGSR